MTVADRLLITHVHKKAPADIFFPVIDPEIWEDVEKEEHLQNDSSQIPYTYIIYRRRNK
jgi:dihydrofolate reductase